MNKNTDQTILDLATRVAGSFRDMPRGLLADRDRDLYDLAHALLTIDMYLSDPTRPPEMVIKRARNVLDQEPGA